MRKIAVLLLAAAGVSLSGAASAADLGTAPIYRKAPPVQVFSWTGGYIGGYVGGAFSAKDAVSGVPVDGAGLPVFAGPAASYKYDSGFIVRGDSKIKDIYDIKSGVRVVDMRSFLPSQDNVEGLLAWAGIYDLEKDVRWVPAHNTEEKASLS